jgi:hypothetical protein
LKDIVADPQEALRQGIIMGIKMACFNVNKSLENYRITLEGIAMVAKWTLD